MKNRILSHRGCWKGGLCKNSFEAILRSYESGYGIETDIRDYGGQIVISHDPPTTLTFTLEDLLRQSGLRNRDSLFTLALNVKSDGLAKILAKHLSKSPDFDCFVFDMSVPDMRHYLELGIPTFTRLSEVERTPIWLEKCQGVWLDAFECDWYSMKIVSDLVAHNKRVCIVSPELHGRDHTDLWHCLRSIWDDKRIYLCTDYPNEASAYLSNKNY